MWKPFGSAAFTVPRWLLIRDGKFGLLTLTLRLQEPVSTPGILSILDQKLQQFEKIFDLEEKLATSNKSASSHYHPQGKPAPVDTEWLQIVEQAQALIAEQKFDKIVLAREEVRHTEDPIMPTKVLNTLRNQYPSCYNFLISNNEGATFIGCSPERLVSFQRKRLTCLRKAWPAVFLGEKQLQKMFTWRSICSTATKTGKNTSM
ncbi:MAG: chorismate-binding protein [Balneolaceae bacterium]|nr:chorismate-binding protein [Balneolaceae bacterium]